MSFKYSNILRSSFETTYSYLKPLAEKNVYLVEDSTGSLFVFKIISSTLISSGTLTSLLSLKHSKLSTIKEYVIIDGYYYLIKPYVDGVTLYELVNLSICTEYECIDITLQLIEILEFLHSQRNPIIFRDLQPKNIIIDTEGNAHLIDCETIHEYSENKSSDTITVGTMGFLAPEQYGFFQSNIQSDMYSLGILMHFMLTGQLPKYEYDKLNLDLLINHNLSKIVAKMTAFNRKKRYKDISVVGKELLLLNKRTTKNLRLVLLGSVALTCAIFILISSLGFNENPNPFTSNNFATSSDTSLRNSNSNIDASQLDNKTPLDVTKDTDINVLPLSPKISYSNDTVIKPILISEPSQLEWKYINFSPADTPSKATTNLQLLTSESNDYLLIKAETTFNDNITMYVFFAGDYPGMTTTIENVSSATLMENVIAIPKHEFTEYVEIHSDQIEPNIVINFYDGSGHYIHFQFNELISDSFPLSNIENQETDGNDVSFLFPELVEVPDIEWSSIPFQYNGPGMPSEVTYEIGKSNHDLFIKTNVPYDTKLVLFLYLSPNGYGTHDGFRNISSVINEDIVVRFDAERFISLIEMNTSTYIGFNFLNNLTGLDDSYYIRLSEIYNYIQSFNNG